MSVCEIHTMKAKTRSVLPFSAVVVGFLSSNVMASETVDETLISEWENEEMGVCFSMVSKNGWKKGLWGVVDALPSNYTDYLQSFVSCMTHKQPMDVYSNRPWGLVMHVTPEYDFWKHFQVIGCGEHEGDIVGGPGDGGSHTPGLADCNLALEAQGKNYAWFTEQKNAILAEYNTVYGIHDYNEFVVNGMLSTAVAGVIHYERASDNHEDMPTEEEMCSLLQKYVAWRTTQWPIYGYGRKNDKSYFRITGYLHCGSTDPTRPTPAPTPGCSGEMVPVDSLECPRDLDALPDCRDVDVGELCEGDGHCGTSQSQDNCGGYDVYRSVSTDLVPARPSFHVIV